MAAAAAGLTKKQVEAELAVEEPEVSRPLKLAYVLWD